jgi:hypothetical protein
MSYNKYKHDATQKHKEAENILKAKHELKKREEEEEAAQKAALEKASAKRNKPKPTIKIGKKKVEENIKMEVKEKPVPAPRKKKEEEKPKEKEYESSSEEEEEKEEEKLEDIKFRFQGKVINSEEVAKFIQEHHEKSAKPERSADTKTVRLNKNASLWRKVSKELDGKKFTDLGNNFGEIVSKAYQKPSSQADFVQMLKMVVMHFTKVPVPEEKRLNMLARKLKTAHVANQK